jgi:hypothetical protein
LDTGTENSIIGLAQARAYCREYRIPFEPTTSASRFILGDQECASLGQLNILLPRPDMDLKFCVDIVCPSVPLLFGIEIWTQKLNLLSVENKLHSVIAGWTFHSFVSKDTLISNGILLRKSFIQENRSTGCINIFSIHPQTNI